MKKNLLFLSLLSFTNLFSQTSQFEKSFEPLFTSGLNSIVNDSSQYLYAVGSSNVPLDYDGTGFFIKLNQDGSFIFQRIFGSYEFNQLNDIDLATDGSLFVCGYSSGCDIGDQGGALIHYATNGDTIWTRLVNKVQLTNGADNVLHHVSCQPNGNVVTTADTTVFIYSSNGDSLHAFATSSHIQSLCAGLNNSIVVGMQSGILELDSAGQQLSLTTFASPVFDIELLSDSTYMVSTGNELYKLDASFAIINQINLVPINFYAQSTDVTQNKIWISNSPGSDFASFDLNLQLVDSFRTQPAEVVVNEFAVFDSLIMVAGTEQSIKNYSYLKTYPVSGSATYYPVDLAIIDVSFDSVWVDQPSPLPAGVYRLNFVARVNVENSGTDTIRNFNLNSEYLLPGFCSGNFYKKIVNNVNLSPGQTASIATDTLREFGISIPAFPFTYHYCPWIACPENRVDKDHSNDQLCDSVVVTGTVGIDGPLPANEFVLYPNPATSFATIEFGNRNADLDVSITDITGKQIKLISVGKSVDKTSIDISDFSRGIYFCTVTGDSFVKTIRFVKE